MTCGTFNSFVMEIILIIKMFIRCSNYRIVKTNTMQILFSRAVINACIKRNNTRKKRKNTKVLRISLYRRILRYNNSNHEMELFEPKINTTTCKWIRSILMTKIIEAHYYLLLDLIPSLWKNKLLKATSKNFRTWMNNSCRSRIKTWLETVVILVNKQSKTPAQEI